MDVLGALLDRAAALKIAPDTRLLDERTFAFLAEGLRRWDLTEAEIETIGAELGVIDLSEIRDAYRNESSSIRSIRERPAHPIFSAPK